MKYFCMILCCLVCAWCRNWMTKRKEQIKKNNDTQKYKTIINTNPIKNRGLTQVTRKGFQLKAITILLYRSFSKMFLTWMFCFVEDNKVISTIEKAITEPDKKKGFSSHFRLLWCVRSRPRRPHSITITALFVPVQLPIFWYFNGHQIRPARCNLEHY